MTGNELKRGVVLGLSATIFLLLVHATLLLCSPPRYVSRATVRLTGFETRPGSSTEEAAVRFQIVEHFADSFVSNAAVGGARARLGPPATRDSYVKARLNSTPVVGSSYVVLSAWDENPGMAQKLVQAALDVRMELYNSRVQGRLIERASLTDRVALSVQKELEEAGEELRKDAGGVDYSGRILAIDRSLVDILNEKSKLRVAIESLGAMGHASALGDTKPEPATRTYLETSETLRKWGVIDLRRQLASSRTALMDARATLGEDHPTTKAAKARVDAAEKELKSFLETQREKESALLVALERTEQELTRVRASYEQAITEERSRELTNATQRARATGLEAALAEISKSRKMIDVTAASVMPLFVIEDPPTLPTHKERPRIVLSILSCPLIGAIFGLIATGPRRKGE